MPTTITVEKLLDAAKLMQRIYDDPDRPEVKHKIENNGVQAYYLKDGTLVIPGTNEFTDWLDFNFEAINLVGKEIRGIAIQAGDSGDYAWHAGFLEHAQTVFTFANLLRPKLIIGHSLGAASAQIVGTFLNVPTFAFASPRPLRGKKTPKGAKHVLNICRSDDSIAHVPPKWWGFRHVGEVVWMNPPGINLGEDHRVDQYRDAMKNDHVRPGLEKKLAKIKLD